MEKYHRKHLLMVGARDAILEILEALPIDITLFQTADRVTPFQYSRARRVIVTDLDDHAEVMSHVAAIHAFHPFHAAVSFLEPFLLITAMICEQLGLRGNPVRPVDLTRNKLKMRELMQGHDIPTVRFRHCTTLDDVRTTFHDFGGPIILKPVDGLGSEGVALIRTADDIPGAWTWSTSDTTALIAEEYIEGPEYSVEGLTHARVHEILAITEKDTTGPPH